METGYGQSGNQDGAALLVIADCALSETQVIVAACILVVMMLGLFIIIVHHNFEAAKRILGK
jgi:hypothetical protein